MPLLSSAGQEVPLHYPRQGPRVVRAPQPQRPRRATRGDTSEERDGGGATASGGYEYLLGMPLWSLTMERVQQLLKEQKETKEEYARLSATSPERLWEVDLDLFLERLEVRHAPPTHAEQTL